MTHHHPSKGWSLVTAGLLVLTSATLITLDPGEAAPSSNAPPAHLVRGHDSVTVATERARIEMSASSSEPFLTLMQHLGLSKMDPLVVRLFPNGQGQAIFPAGYKAAGTYSFRFSDDFLLAVLGPALEHSLFNADPRTFSSVIPLRGATGTSDTGSTAFSFSFAAYTSPANVQAPYSTAFRVRGLMTTASVDPGVERLLEDLRVMRVQINYLAQNARDGAARGLTP